MAWNMLGHSPSEWVLFLILAWSIGVALLVVSAAMRQLPLAVSSLALGVIGLLLFGVAKLAMASRPDAFGGSQGLSGVTWSLAVCLISAAVRLALIVINHLRRDIGSSPAMRIAQAGTGGLLILLVTANLIVFLAASEYSVGDAAFGVVTGLAVLTGAVLTLVSAARGEQDTSLIEFALVLLYAATLAQVGYLTVRPAVATGQAGLAWFQLNTFLVVGALSVAAGNGAYRLVRQACSATPSPMASEPTEENATD